VVHWHILQEEILCERVLHLSFLFPFSFFFPMPSGNGH
jgi:hypothetical protein